MVGVTGAVWAVGVVKVLKVEGAVGGHIAVKL